MTDFFGKVTIRKPKRKRKFLVLGANANADITDANRDSDTLFVKQNEMQERGKITGGRCEVLTVFTLKVTALTNYRHQLG